MNYTLCFAIAAANESCPQPQTSEHLAAIEIMKLKHIIILQNKIDLVKEPQAREQHEQILKFIQGAYDMCDYIERKRTIAVITIDRTLCHNANLEFRYRGGRCADSTNISAAEAQRRRVVPVTRRQGEDPYPHERFHVRAAIDRYPLLRREQTRLRSGRLEGRRRRW